MAKHYIVLRNRIDRDYSVDTDTVVLGIFHNKEQAKECVVEDKWWISKYIVEKITSDPCFKNWIEKYREKLANWHHVTEDELESIHGENRDTDCRYTYQISRVRITITTNIETE